MKLGYKQKHLSFIYRCLAIAILVCCSTVSIFAQESKILPAPVVETPFYILFLPSSECINCKAVTTEIIQYFLSHKDTDSLIVLTDNDAGAYYAESNEEIDNKFPVIIDKKMSDLISSDGKAALCYRGDSYIQVEKITSSPDELFKKLDKSSANRTGTVLSPFRMDSVKLKYNIFSSFANSIVQTKGGNILILSKTNNAGCLLFPELSDNISPI